MTFARILIVATSLLAGTSALGMAAPADASPLLADEFDAPNCYPVQYQDTVGESIVSFTETCLSVIPESPNIYVTIRGKGAGVDGIVHVQVVMDGQEFAKSDAHVENPSASSPWGVAVVLPPSPPPGPAGRSWYTIKAWTSHGSSTAGYTWTQTRIGRS
ncbi:hypothetical protein LVJ94_38180 [Pendulispora rubella]|uniref:Secreted protein n=1 Tax=Pendulispora rubella TaxID=2741070 RepID=A0ABZ2KY91_9BACT